MGAESASAGISLTLIYIAYLNLSTLPYHNTRRKVPELWGGDMQKAVLTWPIGKFFSIRICVFTMRHFAI